MTPERERPADIARRALRAAREASGAAEAPPPDAVPETAEKPPRSAASSATERRPYGAAPGEAGGSPHKAAPGGGEVSRGTDGTVGPSARRPKPGDAARAAIRPTASGSPADEALGQPARPDGGASRHEGHLDARPDARPERHLDNRSEHRTDTRSDGRPGDVARQALRAARQDTRRADEPDQAAGPAPATGHAPVQPRTGAAPGGPGRDVRQFLADALRTPPTTAAAAEHTETPAGQSPSDGPPHLPRTMATPHRDGELRRTFPAFPGRTASGGPEASFAATWWGNAWVAALEQGALDAARLARGRGYAEQGHVDAITVTPGLVLAYVRGSRPRPYRVQVRLRTFDEADWEQFLDAAAEQPGRIAALLDRRLPAPLADSGAALLPGPGDLDPRCSCPDSGHPCKHAAALCYQTARLLDADPFVLLLLRGRGERRLLDALSRRSATAAARAAQDRQPRPLPGVRAAEALAVRRLPPLPAPLPPPAHPEQPPVYPAAPGGPDPFGLDQLATDAAARAHALLSTGRDAVGELTLWQDAVRLAAARPGSGLTAATRALYSSLAAAAGRTSAELARAVAAWRQGGLDGLAALEEPWDPPAGRFDRARPLLLAADLPAFRPWRNHLTHPQGHVQLRLGRDGLWYAYESEPGHDDWWPRGTPDQDPVGALTGLGIPGAD